MKFYNLCTILDSEIAKNMQNKDSFLILSWQDSNHTNFVTISEIIISNRIILHELNLLTSGQGFIGIIKFLWIVWLSLFELGGHFHKFLITDPVIFVGSIKSQSMVVSSICSTSPKNDNNKGLHNNLGFSTKKGWRGDKQRIVLMLTSNCPR